MFDLLNRAYSDTHKRIVHIHFDKTVFLHTAIISLYASIIEQTGSAIALLKDNHVVAANIILRSTLEAHVDLINLTNDANYIEQMKASYHEQWVYLMEAGISGNTPFLKEFVTDDVTDSLAYNRRSLAKYKAAGVRPMKVSERFKKAGMSEWYVSVYNHLCADSHNNLRALIKRHIRQKEDGMEVVVFRNIKGNEIAEAAGFFAHLYLASSAAAHNYFGSKSLEVVVHYTDQLVDLINRQKA